MCDQKITMLIDSAMKNYKMIDYIVSVDGQTGKGDGYSGSIIFVSVTGTKDGIKESVHLAIKCSIENEKIRKEVGVKECYEKEIFMYKEVKSAFDKLQNENGIHSPVTVMPHYYAACVTETREMLILENLKIKGFSLWDRKIPMTFKHVGLVLEAYGQWHALSIGLKTKSPETFKQLMQNNVNMMTHFITRVKMTDVIAEEFEKAKKAVISDDEKDILEYLQFSRDDVIYALTDMFFEEENYHVILHGDCWNNNFMFKFSNEISNPSEVRILDWQCSGLGSPVIDLSHFIYACCDTGTYQDVKELLEIYYKSFSDCLNRIGCEASHIFTFDTLVDHWKRFSKYGMFFSNFIVKVCSTETDQLPDSAENAEQGKNFSENFNMSVTNDIYLKRVRNNLLHFVRNIKN